MKKKSINPDIVIAVFLLLAAAFLMSHAFTAQSAEARQFPVLILGIFMILAAAMLVNGIRAMKNEEADEEKNRALFGQMKYPMLCFVFIVLYVIAVDIVGFIIPSLIFTAGLMWFNYERKPLPLILVPCGLVGFLYVLFTFILHSKMP